MAEGMSRGEAMGLFDGSGMPRSELDRLQARLKELPPSVGVETSAVAEAREAALDKYNELDAILTSSTAYDLLTRPVEEIADAQYREALKAGEKDPAYPADRLRAEKVRIVHDFESRLPEYREAVSRVKAAIRDTLPEAAEITAARYTEAEAAYREAWFAYQRAKSAFADAVDARAEVLEAGGDGENFKLGIRTSLRNHPVSDAVTGPAHEREPVDVVREVSARFESLGLPDPGTVGTGRKRGASGESASFDDKRVWA